MEEMKLEEKRLQELSKKKRKWIIIGFCLTKLPKFTKMAKSKQKISLSTVL